MGAIYFYGFLLVQLMWWFVVVYGCIVLCKKRTSGVALVTFSSFILALINTSITFLGSAQVNDAEGSFISVIEPFIPHVVSDPLEKVASALLVGGILLMLKDVSNRDSSV